MLTLVISVSGSLVPPRHDLHHHRTHAHTASRAVHPPDAASSEITAHLDSADRSGLDEEQGDGWVGRGVRVFRLCLAQHA